MIYTKKKAIIRGALLGGGIFTYVTFAATQIGHEWHFTGAESGYTYFMHPLIGFLCFWICGGSSLCD